ncbi:GDSL-like Lipase/Acylhydrolase-domain-containing protein [Chytridium lagenaria]|nr:GDSL-like Lipase/Acylhydrolase-domain-containing protein [Chytridium lagenaria]
MKLTSALLAITAAVFVSAQTPVYTDVVVFGDSYSDSGNVYNSTGGLAPQSPPYFEGRFSDGPVWVENVAIALNATLRNFAYGGAVANITNVPAASQARFSRTPDLPAQIELFAQRGLTLNPDTTLYIVYIGGNDYLAALFAQNLPIPAVIAGSVAAGINTLVTRFGAKNVLTQTLGPLQATPVVRNILANPAAAASVGTLIRNIAPSHNTALRRILLSYQAANPFNVIWVDTYGLLETLTTGSSNPYNITITDKSCLAPAVTTTAAARPTSAASFSRSEPDSFPISNLRRRQAADGSGATVTLCPNPENYLFFDNIHPTAIGHKVLGDVSVQAIGAGVKLSDVPVSGSTANRPLLHPLCPLPLLHLNLRFRPPLLPQLLPSRRRGYENGMGVGDCCFGVIGVLDMMVNWLLV